MRPELFEKVVIFELISIHAPVKGATWVVNNSYFCLKYFNPRTREGCDTFALISYLFYLQNFNPRPREGCDETYINYLEVLILISIHAPVKGATYKAKMF